MKITFLPLPHGYVLGGVFRVNVDVISNFRLFNRPSVVVMLLFPYTILIMVIYYT